MANHAVPLIVAVLLCACPPGVAQEADYPSRPIRIIAGFTPGGGPGYESELWFGLLAPAGVPRAILAKLNSDITKILSEAETRSRWLAIGIEPRPTTPEEFDHLVRREIALFTRIARAAGIRAD